MNLIDNRGTCLNPLGIEPIEVCLRTPRWKESKGNGNNSRKPIGIMKNKMGSLVRKKTESNFRCRTNIIIELIEVSLNNVFRFRDIH